ncbi:MAG TPA: response regulator [Kouleothrix sp.]|uniref:response regulator n=1 Tax=Kouleothrix sp. TaxID=2779161 RepID=UPI002CAAB20A|nr:response regulator [Kouleothrix sp.]HRC75775.1 response regulator [Kouleothrix sp.]
MNTTILVVDDSSDIRTVVRYSLTDRGFQVIEASDGPQAIQLARQHRPALILLDLCIPGIDGWEVASRLRSDPALEDIPIVAMTAYDVSSAIRAAQTAGCQKVVAKPFDLVEMAHTVARLVSPAELPRPHYA